MAIKADYVLRETGTNLFRNFSITIASILTISVSLFLFGVSLMLSQGVNNATRQWQGGIEFIIFINPNATHDEQTAIQQQLDSSPEIEKTTYVDQNAAFEEFKQLFAKQPELIESVTADILPPSYRVVPKNKSSEAVAALSEQYKGKAGVRDVVSATDTIRLVQQLSSRLTFGMVVVDPQHDPHGDVREAARDRGDEAGRRDQLVHPRAVHGRGARPGRDRRRSGHRLLGTLQTVLREVAT
jgi:cell division transport system permease protein